MSGPFYTLGHSTSTLEYFTSLLLGYEIARLIDVRTLPRSRFNPQFNRESLPFNLKTLGIAYTHRGGLGGLRRPLKDSPNGGWRNSNFRGYADYMQTAEFEKNLEWLMAAGKKERITFMCAEAVPWRCHRSLIADALTARGLAVHNIQSRVSAPLHQLTPFAQVRAGRVTYPPTQRELFEA